MPQISKDQRTVTFELLQPYSSVKAFSTLRKGGVSKGAYASLNCGLYTKDEGDRIRKNLQAAFFSADVHPREVFLPHQVHGSRILAIEERHLGMGKEEKKALLEGWDAMMTKQKGILIGVSTADCIPVILYDPVQEACAAIHAGWKGTLSGITRSAVRAMKEAFKCQAGDILSVIGPGIRLESFEVGDEVYQAFLQAGYDMDRISRMNAASGKHHIDLPMVNRLQMEEEGILVEHIQDSGICTRNCHEEFFSARYLGVESGRILTAVMMEDSPI